MILRPLAFFAALMAATPIGAADASLDEGADPLAVWQADPTVIFEAGDIDLAAFQWIARPIVIFADTPADPRFKEQMELLTARPGELAERDVIVITDTDPSEPSAIRRTLRPRGFMVALIDKDGRVNLRKPFPWSVRELSRSIDKMPLRQEEIRARRGSQG